MICKSDIGDHLFSLFFSLTSVPASPVDDTLHAYLLNAKFLDEENLLKQSLEREPPGGVQASPEEDARTSIFDSAGKLAKGELRAFPP